MRTSGNYCIFSRCIHINLFMTYSKMFLNISIRLICWIFFSPILKSGTTCVPSLSGTALVLQDLCTTAWKTIHEEYYDVPNINFMPLWKRIQPDHQLLFSGLPKAEDLNYFKVKCYSPMKSLSIANFNFVPSS